MYSEVQSTINSLGRIRNADYWLNYIEIYACIYRMQAIWCLIVGISMYVALHTASRHAEGSLIVVGHHSFQKTNLISDRLLFVNQNYGRSFVVPVKLVA